ncbi:MAG TPA: nuclear transport factor 2 family protein [Phnomibacter sp.]|nr:nuclear transport factor 2 family protein [Phnomibacter sp.]
MARIFLLLTGIVLISAFSVAQNAPAEKFVKAFSEKKNRWLIEKNYDSLRTMLDKRCLYIHSNGWTQSADDVVNDLKSGKMVYNKMTIEESQARQFESMVIVTGKGRFEGSVDKKPFDLRLAFTEVYIKRKESWKLVSRQSAKLE